MNVLDTLWAVRKVQERLGARLVRYADNKKIRRDAAMHVLSLFYWMLTKK